MLLFFSTIVKAQNCLNDGGEPFTNGAAAFRDMNGACTTMTNNDTPLIIKVFPNPTRDFVTIWGKNTEGELNVYDAVGRHLFSSQRNAIDFTNFAAGIYFLRIEKQIFKIIKI